MAPTRLESLPLELLSSIGAFLPQAGCINLSSTNSYFRSVLAPLGFHAVELTNNPDNDWESLRRLANNYGQHVRKLRFVGNLYEDTRGDGCHPAVAGNGNTSDEPQDAPSLVATIGDGLLLSSLRFAPLPRIIHEALRGTLFPAADTYVVTFKFEFLDLLDEGHPWEHVWGGPAELIFEEMSNKEAYNESDEARYPWRALMAWVWRLLSQNMNVKTLVAKDLLPKPTTPFFSQQWFDFLARLDRLEISMWAEDNGDTWICHREPGYSDFIELLGQYFFQHATHAQSLVLEAHPECPFGHHADAIDIRLPLESGQLPELRHLELRNLYISPELVHFVCQENSKLARLVLRNCHANTRSVWHDPRLLGTGEIYDYYQWALFFDGLTANDNNTLSSFVVQYDKLVSMRRPEPIVAHVNNCESSRRMTELEVSYQAPGAIVFDYGQGSDRHDEGFLQDFERNHDHFTQGHDLAAFQSLAARIELNKGSSEEEDTGASYVVLSSELY
ncbi:hypothetical protein BJ166DRAFT_349249 [Pestalotiopsis sp. NC0098]|nr:hypothetical protein BJ166DRAFT_349249 [Pestalotiopsis sp. NC0098]